MLRHHREIIDALQEMGGVNITLKHRGKHPKVYWEKDGYEYHCTIAVSPSCHRALRNTLKHMSRMMKHIAGPDGRPLQVKGHV